MKQIVLTMLALALMLMVSSPAFAVLNAVGPVDPGNGFPRYYQDTNGLTLELCIPNVQELADGACLILPADVPSPLAPIVFPTNFPGEAFWWAGGTIIDLPGGGSADLVMALEAAFAFEEPIQGDQVSFGRVRIRVDIPAPGGNYVVTTPYGIFPFNNVQPGVRAINMTQDIGITVPGVFTGALGSSIGPYLRPSLTPGGAPLPFFDLYPGSGKLYIAQPAALGPVTGGPFGNVFRVEGPNIGGPGINSIETVNFELVGRLFDGILPTPLTPTRATYSRTGTGQGQIDIFADAPATATVSVSGGPNMPAGQVPLTGSPLGNFFAAIPLADASVLPPFITVTAGNTGNSTTTIAVPLVDMVTITQADYSPVKRTLAVKASSSDGAVAQTLTAEGFGPLTNGALTVASLAAPPAVIAVTSSAGGMDMKQVALVIAPTKIGTYTNGTWKLDDGNGIFNPAADTTFFFGGVSGDIPVTGDWDGDGDTEAGVFRSGSWYIDLNSDGVNNDCPSTGCYRFGVVAGDIPVTGDWNGDGKTEIGVYRSGGYWYLDGNGNGVFNTGIDPLYRMGVVAGDKPVTGDWNGDGKTDIGIYRSGSWYLDMNGNGVFEAGIDRLSTFGTAADTPVTGDWNGDGRTDIGLFNAGQWTLDNGNGAPGPGDTTFMFGAAGDRPVTGSW